jgi:Glycosyl hydrolases family 16
VLDREERFDGPRLDRGLWVPAYLPQWSSRDASAPRYELREGGGLRLRIDPDQPPWCPEWDGALRVSSLQTGVFAGPMGSRIGQHRFHPDVVVREEQPAERLHTPRYGVIETRLGASADPRCMVALWMIGFEDLPDRSGEICVVEIFGRDVAPGRTAVGMGVHPHHDGRIRDDFQRVPLDIDVAAPHDYAVVWTPDWLAWYVDERLVRSVDQAIDYPMQLMLGIYGFPSPDPSPDAPFEPPPGILDVERVRTWRAAP